MDARSLKAALVLLSVLCSTGAVYRTPNFTVSAPDEKTARLVGQHAERYRVELAELWLGHELPRWAKPCPIQVRVGQIGAGGATSFAFDRGQVFGWKMNVQGTLERILDSVLPHEVSHTIFACHFRRPLPRWADEGAATLVEHESEKRRQTLLLDQVLKNGSRIPLRQLLSMKEYPKDMQRVLTLYAQGYSLADFLIEQGGRTKYLRFLQSAHEQGWDAAIRTFYEHESVELLEKRWSNWVMAGSPRLGADDVMLAEKDKESQLLEAPSIRAQSPETETDRLPRGGLVQPVSKIETPESTDEMAGRPSTSAAGPHRVPATGRRTLPMIDQAGRSQAREDGWQLQSVAASGLVGVDSHTRRLAAEAEPRWADEPYRELTETAQTVTAEAETERTRNAEGVIDPRFAFEDRGTPSDSSHWSDFPQRSAR